MGISLEDTQKKLDKALKRNQINQEKIIVAPTNQLNPEASEQEQNIETKDQVNFK